MSDKIQDTKSTASVPEEKQTGAQAGPTVAKGVVTIAQICADFKSQIEIAAQSALNSAYSRFVNECDRWTEEDVESNTASHAREAIREMLAGKDPAYVVSRIKEYGIEQADAIRDLIWKQCGDELVKKSLEVKDAEIARLTAALAESRYRV